MAQHSPADPSDVTRTAGTPTTVGPTPPSVAGDPLLGAVIGRGYRLTKLLGEGGMGAVYEASSPSGERVALKLIRGQQDGEALRRFVREVRAMQAIQSPHVVRVIDADTDASQGLPYIVMELLDGRDLGAFIRELGPLDPSRMARLFLQAGQGLAAIHDAGLIHRDIKPSNIFLHHGAEGLVAKVCDFGVAKHTGSDTGTELTHTGGIVGSPHYMSPEQVQDSKHVDRRSDLWSLSMAMYEALSGHKGWAQCTSVGEVLVAICTRDLPPLRREAPWVSDGLAEIIQRNLRRPTGERFASALEFAAALKPFAAEQIDAASLAVSEELRAASPPLIEASTVSTREPPSPPTSRKNVFGAALLAAGLAAGLGLLQSRPRETPAVASALAAPALSATAPPAASAAPPAASSAAPPAASAPTAASVAPTAPAAVAPPVDGSKGKPGKGPATATTAVTTATAATPPSTAAGAAGASIKLQKEW